MNDQRLDSIIADWLGEGPERGPRHGLDRALAATRRVEQRPAWTFATRWIPQPARSWRVVVPQSAVLLLLLLVGLLIVALLAVAVGGRPPRITSPFGEAGQRLVAFEQIGSIAVSRIDGSAQRTLTAGIPYARSPQFSPDGKRVAFVAPTAMAGLAGRLYVVPVDGSKRPIELSRGIEVSANKVSNVAWSPDGTRLAFAGHVEGIDRIFVAAADGRSLTPITDLSADRDLPAWSPDGTRIAFRTREPDGVRTRLQTALPDGGDIAEVTLVIASDAALSKLRFGGASKPFSYAYNPGFGSQTSAFVDLSFQHVNQIWTEGIGGFADNGIPWSPDYQKLAVLTARDGVIIADHDPTTPYHGNLRRLGPLADCWVDWAPDGTGLYGGSPGDCSQTILIPLSDPSNTYRLPGSSSGTASWQPLAP